MLHLPDFLGYESAIELARDNPDRRRAGARAEEDRQRGDDASSAAARCTRSTSASAAGTARPRKRELAAARREARAGARDRARDRAPRPPGSTSRTTSRTTSSSRSTSRASTRSTAGRIVSNARARHRRRPSTTTTSSRSTSSGRTRCTRTLSRARLLPLRAARAVRALRRPALARRRARPPRTPASTPDERNPFRSIVVRSVELVYAADEALRLIAEYEEPDAPAVEVEPRAGVGYGCTEAPRGILYHRYELDDDGTILDAKIVPPTSQNQRTIEEDLRGVVERILDVPDDELALLCEQTIRNYDPCISCATHFLQARGRAR